MAEGSFTGAVKHQHAQIFRSVYRRLLREAHYLDTYPLVKSLLPVPKHLKEYTGDVPFFYTLNGMSYVRVVKNIFLSHAPQNGRVGNVFEDSSHPTAAEMESKDMRSLRWRYCFLSTTIPLEHSKYAADAESHERTMRQQNYGRLLSASFDALQRIREHKEWCRMHLPVLMRQRAAIYNQIDAHKTSLFLLRDGVTGKFDVPPKTIRIRGLARERFMKGADSHEMEHAEEGHNAAFSPRSSRFLSPFLLSCLAEAKKILDPSASTGEHAKGMEWEANAFRKDLGSEKKVSWHGMKDEWEGLPPAFRLWAEPLEWTPVGSTSTPFSSRYFSRPARYYPSSGTLLFYDPDMPWGIGAPPTTSSSSVDKLYSDFTVPLIAAASGGSQPRGSINKNLTAASDQPYEESAVRAEEEDDNDELDGGSKAERTKKKRIFPHPTLGGENPSFSFSIVARKGQGTTTASTETDASVDGLSTAPQPFAENSNTSGGSSSTSYSSPFPVVDFFTGRLPSLRSFSTPSSAVVSLPTPEVLPPGLPPGTVLLAHPCSSHFTTTSRVFLITRRSSVFTTGVLLDAEYMHSISPGHPVFPEIFWGHPIRNGGSQKTTSTMPPTPSVTVLHTLDAPPCTSPFRRRKGPRETMAAFMEHAHHCEPLILPGNPNAVEKVSRFSHHQERQRTLRKNRILKKRYLHEMEMEEAMEGSGSASSSRKDSPTLYISHVESLPYLASLISEHDRSHENKPSKRGLSSVSRRNVHIFWGSQRYYTSQLEEEVQAGQWIPVRVSPGFLYAATSFQPSGFSPTRPLPFPSEDSSTLSSFGSGKAFQEYQKGEKAQEAKIARRHPLQDFFPSEHMLKEMRKRKEKGWTQAAGTFPSTTEEPSEEKPFSHAWNSFSVSRNQNPVHKRPAPYYRSPSTAPWEVDDDDDLDQAELDELLNDEDLLSWSAGLEGKAGHESPRPVPLWDVLLYAMGGEHRSLIGFGAKDRTS